LSGLKPVLARLAGGGRLSADEAEAAFGVIMDGAATDAQIAALLTALHIRGETGAELAGATRAMRARMHAIAAPPGAIDVCGTGGDGFHTLNVSTAVAFVVAGCGVAVAKHGNRAISSRSGAYDVLQALGVAVDVPIDQLASRLAEDGLVFMFAPRHHPAARHAARVRAELGIRTMFNLLGPMANPARVTRQLTGAYSPSWTAPMAETLGALGTGHAWVVHGAGLDELTLSGPSHVSEWRDGHLRNFTVTPDQAGLPSAGIDAIRGGDAAQNAAALVALLQAARSAYRDTVLLNAAAALIIAGRAGDLREGATLASRAIDSGAALHRLERARRPADLPEQKCPTS
jgi:anthranilate phosphoribosyltransferase